MLQAKIVNMIVGTCALVLFLTGIVDKTLERREYFIMGGLAIFIVTFIYYTFSKVYYYKP